MHRKPVGRKSNQKLATHSEPVTCSRAPTSVPAIIKIKKQGKTQRSNTPEPDRGTPVYHKYLTYNTRKMVETFCGLVALKVDGDAVPLLTSQSLMCATMWLLYE